MSLENKFEQPSIYYISVLEIDEQITYSHIVPKPVSSLRNHQQLLELEKKINVILFWFHLCHQEVLQRGQAFII